MSFNLPPERTGHISPPVDPELINIILVNQIVILDSVWYSDTAFDTAEKGYSHYVCTSSHPSFSLDTDQGPTLNYPRLDTHTFRTST